MKITLKLWKQLRNYEHTLKTKKSKRFLLRQDFSILKKADLKKKLPKTVKIWAREKSSSFASAEPFLDILRKNKVVLLDD